MSRKVSGVIHLNRTFFAIWQNAPVYDSSRLLNSIGQFDPLIPVKVDLSGKQWLSVQQIMKVPSLAI